MRKLTYRGTSTKRWKRISVNQGANTFEFLFLLELSMFIGRGTTLLEVTRNEDICLYDLFFITGTRVKYIFLNFRRVF